MTKSSLELILRALNDAGVRYLIVGGLAVNAHGYVRFTADVDLILSLDDANVRSAIEVLKGLGYRPRAPVPIEQFGDAANRQMWIEQKGLKAFSLFSPAHSATEVDLFIDDPLGMDAALKRAVHVELLPELKVPVCSLKDLLKLKRDAGREKDVADIARLKLLYPDAE